MLIKNNLKYSISIILLLFIFTSCPTPGFNDVNIPEPMLMMLKTKNTLSPIFNGETVNEDVILYYSSPNNLNPNDGKFYYCIDDSNNFNVLNSGETVEISENGDYHIEIYFENNLGERGDSFSSCDFTINKQIIKPTFNLLNDSFKALGDITKSESIYIEPTFYDDDTNPSTFQYRIGGNSNPWITTYDRVKIYQTSENENSSIIVDIRYKEYEHFGEDAINSKTINIDRAPPIPLSFNTPNSQEFRMAKILWTNNNTDLIKINVYYKKDGDENYTLLKTIEDGTSIIGEGGFNEVSAIDDIIYKYVLIDRAKNETICLSDPITPNTISDNSTILYVSPDGSGYGASWETAYGNLQDAIDDAASHSIKNIYVKEGTYYPTSHPNGLESYEEKGLHFALKNNLTITGGFIGNEGIDENPSGGETILDGNEISNHVIYLTENANISSSAVLNNVSIKGGKAYGPSYIGGGIYLEKASPTLKNIKLYNNEASIGAAIYIEDSTIELNDISVFENTSSNYGAVHINAWESQYSQKFSRMKIFNNNSYAITSESNKPIKVDLENCSIFKNKNEIFKVNSSSLINMYNSSIAFNEESWIDGSFSTESNIINTIIWKNGNINSSATYFPSDSGSNAKCSIIQDKNINGDGYIFIPSDTRIFKYNDNDSLNEDHLSLYENVLNPALDMGINIDGLTTDIIGNQRLVELSLYIINDLRPNDVNLIDERSGTDEYKNDLGAYELQKPDVMPDYIFVDNNASIFEYSLFGSSKDTPSNDIQNALYLASINDIDEVHVAKGIYYPKERAAISSDNSSDSDRFFHFMLVNGVKLIGGYESSFTNEFDNTTLSANIGDKNTNTDNCYHVFYHSGNLHQLDSSAWIQRCTISDGYAFGYLNHTSGGGMYNCASYPTIVDCKFKDNYANNGGAIYSIMDNGASNTQSIWQSVFLNNKAHNSGGAIYIKDDINLDLNQCVFLNNDCESELGAPSLHIEPSASLNCYQSTFVNNPSTGNLEKTSIIIESGGTTPSKFYNSFIFQGVDDYIGIDGESGEKIRESLYYNTAIPHDIITDGIVFVPTSYSENFAKISFDQILLETDLYFRHDINIQNQFLYHSGDITYLLKDEVDLDNDNNTSEYLPYDILYNPRLTNNELSIGAIQSEVEYFNY